MEFIPEVIDDYCGAHSSPQNTLLDKITRETHRKVMMPRMLSGHLQGRYLSMIAHMIRPQVVLEIGTFTGFSTLCFAEGLAEKGKLITIDINEELEEMVRGFFKESAYDSQIEYLIGDAKAIIPTIQDEIDLAFIDADKINYQLYYDAILPKMKKGGIILADNVLWSGKIVMDESKADKDTKALIAFNKFVQNDTRVENMLLPLRDGIMMIRVK